MAPMAIGGVFGSSMDNCFLLSISWHQKCWQSGLFHRTLSLRHVDGDFGKFLNPHSAFVCV